jgi:O-antigen/teichoic acid export membrane protein
MRRAPNAAMHSSTTSPARPAAPPRASGAGDMLFGMGGKLLYAASRVALPPLALAHMDLADYGLWSACFVLVSYVGMAAAGFSLVYLRQTARHHLNGDIAAISRLLSTGMLTMGTLALLLLGTLALSMPTLMQLLRVPPPQQALAAQLWLGAVAVFLADMSLGAFAQVLQATGRLRLEQKVWMAAFLLEAVLMVGLLRLGLGVHALLLAFAGRYLFSALANARLAWRGLPGLRLSPRLFDARLLRDFFLYGGAMQLSGLLATALGSADRLLAGLLLGPTASGLSDLASKLPISAAAASSGISGVAVAVTARHEAAGHEQALLQVFREALRLTVASLALIMPFLALFAPWLCLAWLGPQGPHAEVAALMPWLVLAHHAHLLTGPATALARGQGRLGPDFAYHALRGILLGAALLLLLRGGAPGLQALLTILCLAQGTAALVFGCVAQRRLPGAGHAILHLTLLPTALSLGLAALLAVVLGTLVPPPTSRPEALMALSLALSLWMVLALPLLAVLLLQRTERQRLRQALSRRRLPPALENPQ